MSKKKQPTKMCPIDNCWEQIPLGRALCPACSSWWHRMQIKDEHELATYVQRVSRFTGRLHRIGGLHRIPTYSRKRRAA